MPPVRSNSAEFAKTNALLSLVGAATDDDDARALIAAWAFPKDRFHPTRGVGYSIEKRVITAVSFYAACGIETMPELDDPLIEYEHALPLGIQFTQTRAQLTERLGTPHDVIMDFDEWHFPEENRRIFVGFIGQRMASVTWSMPR